MKWKTVLEANDKKYSKLKINLAHLGTKKFLWVFNSKKWRNTIRALISEYENVYIVLGFIFSNMKREARWDSGKMLKYIIWAVVISGVVVAGFFLPYLKAPGLTKY